MSTKTNLALVGGSGRLGSAIQKILDPKKFTLSLQVGRSNTPDLRTAELDVVLDVSLPDATLVCLETLLKAEKLPSYVIGCTGWSDSQLKTVHQYAQKAPIVLAPNFSPGVNLFLSLLERAAPLLKDWGYVVDIHETHHTKKLDAPSGTAKAIVERLGNMSAEVHSTRTGNIVGTHEVRFVGPEDILLLRHEALDRLIFARGALLAATWAAQCKTPAFTP